VLLLVVALDAVGDVLALADIGHRLAVLVAEQQVNAGVPGLLAIERRLDSCPRRHQDVAGPVEYLGGLHAVRAAVDEVEFERAPGGSDHHAASVVSAATTPRTSILPVTAAEIRADRRSFRRSITAWAADTNTAELVK